MNQPEPLWKAIITGSWVKRFVEVPSQPVSAWKKVVHGLFGLALLAVMIVVVARFSGLSRAQVDEWGEFLVMAPFLVSTVILLYMRRRRRP